MLACGLFNEHNKNSNFVGMVTRSALGKQNRQAKKVYHTPFLECFRFFYSFAPQNLRYNQGREPSLQSLLRDVSYELIILPSYDCHPLCGGELNELSSSCHRMSSQVCWSLYNVIRIEIIESIHHLGTMRNNAPIWESFLRSRSGQDNLK